jgi:predicted ATPase/class 3 adenylate cyclase
MADVPLQSSTREPGVRTFLFADIRGYTRYIVEHGDAAGAQMLDLFGQLVRDSVKPREGDVIGVVGDEAFVAFVSARNALRAALELQSRVGKSSTGNPAIPLQVGIGLDSGEALPTPDSFVGAALNLAARLCKLAGAQEILASDSVVHVAGKLDKVGYVERGFVQLKGFSEPVHVFRVIDEQAGPIPDVALGLAGGSAPSFERPLPIGAFLGALPSTELVAREKELARAMAAADAVVSGSGRLLLLSGEPGVGKTRLAQEIMLTARNRRYVVATGRCYQVQQTVPFYPFLDALTSAYLAAPPALRAQVPSRWPYLCRLLPEIRSASSAVIVSTPEEQQLLFREVTAFLQEIASSTPIALMIDDLQWADSASIELLQHVTRHTRASRVLLVGTYRDVELGRHHPLEAAMRDLMREDLLDRVPVRRLEPSGSALLVAATLGEANVSEDLDRLVHHYADGNPFFTQQLVRFLVERGDIYREGGRWVERPSRRIEVPESVRSVIGQRMERLTPNTQELLREAAVLGQTFSFDGVMRLSGRPETDVEADLDEARTTGLVEERAFNQYAFDHALTQQTLYGELSSRKRHRLHLAAAEGLERLVPEERGPRSAELAWHFLEAGQEARAVPYALAAGDQARSVFAHKEAEQQYTAVLEIATHTHDRSVRIDALSRRAKLFLDLFEGKKAVADYEALLQESQAAGDRGLELRSRLGLALSSYIVALDETSRDLASKCREMAESAVALAEELGDEHAKAEGLLSTRFLADFFPEYRVLARSNVHEALSIARRLGDADLILAGELATWYDGSRAEVEARVTRLIQTLKDRHDFHRLNILYFVMMWQNLDWAEYERAVEVCDLGIQLAAAIGVPPVQYPTLKALALLELGRYGEAGDSLTHEVIDAEHPFGQAMQTLGLGTYYLELRAFDRAEMTFRDLLVRAAKLRRAWMRGWALRGIARSLVRSGRIKQGEWEEIQRQLKDAGLRVDAAVKSEVLLSLGRPLEALQTARESMVEAKDEESLAEELSAMESEAAALLADRKAKEAAEVADRACRNSERHRGLSRLWRLLDLKSRALQELRDETGALTARQKAREVLREVGGSIADSDLKRGFFADPLVHAILEPS